MLKHILPIVFIKELFHLCDIILWRMKLKERTCVPPYYFNFLFSCPTLTASFPFLVSPEVCRASRVGDTGSALIIAFLQPGWPGLLGRGVSPPACSVKVLRLWSET